ncbi:glycoside hydrolase superfamily [Epithele typhae]|uniref:glycoside hydrolase superfamily n=1 Tax=Epithele typhae TaxID=378194 RepID=UPI002007C2BE|nr:glycoside hydrolase superfamily [Epithele typhae]KAH9917691.1 glycoside hydrolase superfamily [Epithele typhae]
MLSFSRLGALAGVVVGLAKLPTAVLALDNGVGKLPAMGFNSLSLPKANLTEAAMREAANLMATLGLRDLGYSYVNFDSGWAIPNRGADGELVADPGRFPSGMRALTDFIHSLDLKAGIYGSSGWFFCDGVQPGSFSNELKDVQQWQISWGFDYVKLLIAPFDDVSREGPAGLYQRTADAIAQVSQEFFRTPMFLSLGGAAVSVTPLWTAKSSR